MVRAAAASTTDDLLELLSDAAATPELHTLDERFRHLRTCVREYAAKLRFLGYSTRSAAGMVLAAVREAVPIGNPPAALLSAARDWAMESDDATAR